jgi:site-specific recombinase
MLIPDQHKNSELRAFVRFLASVRRLEQKELELVVEDYLGNLLKNGRSEQLSAELSTIFFTNSLTDAGINSNRGFFPELRQRIKNRILPPINEDHFFSHVVAETFGKQDDRILERLSDPNWQRVFSLLKFSQETKLGLNDQLKNAIIILAHQLVSIGIDPYLVKKLPSTDDTDSPFFRMNLRVNEYLKGAPVSVSELLGELEVCDEIFDYLKENRATIGISLHLTFLIRRAEQHSRRLKLLLRLHDAGDPAARLPLLKELLITLVRGELHRNSILYFAGENTNLLANRIANQTSSRGSDYIGFTKKENNRLLLSAIGGGCVVVVLVYIKHFIHLLHLPLLPEGILFGLNYGLGFVFMHFAHLTLATKQPAMTASYIAESIEQKGLTKEARKELSLILAQIMRSQFISLIGNLLAVLPLCFLSAWALVKFSGLHVFSLKEASAYLYGNHPLLSGALFYATFAGIFLTLAGLITGYYDNKVIFSSIPRRVMEHPFLKRSLSPAFLQKFAGLVSRHLGAVIGNLCLGLFLGLAGNLGKFMGLPFDIRHVTISTGNFAISVAQGYGFSKLFMASVFLGVLLIGLINIISSFLFSFLIACRSRYLTSQQTWLVLGSMVKYIFENPRILLFRKDRTKPDH